ncbi:MAG: sodium ion-translocating decarboxylase subunit beta [Candidatus Bathyarchaeota archaeon]|nr:MAG: sodium ion-translocating decarboxylase subunit beta [Candidatus Bathyarchaeota archaeon]
MWQILGEIVMMSVGLILIYLAVSKGYEPLLLLPIGFGAVLANIPFADIAASGGILDVLRVHGIENELLPALIFVGIGAMSDFTSLIRRPMLLIFAAAGQLGIFLTLNLALVLGFSPLEASSIGIIGAMDGPTAIFVTQRFAPHLLGPVTVCAYSYMSLVPLLQIPLSRWLTTRSERSIAMEYKEEELPRAVRVLFPVIVFLVSSFLAPQGALLMGTLMLGNLMRESGVVGRLSDVAQNELANIVTLLLGLSIGGTMTAEAFLNTSTLYVFALGLVAFILAISFGLLFAKLMKALTGGKINPLIGACGVSAFPMAARTAHMLGRQEDQDNWLLPHTLATNVGGQIASVAAGGAILSYVPFVLGLLGIA